MGDIIELNEPPTYIVRTHQELNSRNPNTVRYGKETIYFLTSKIWAIVPQNMKNCSSLSSFKIYLVSLFWRSNQVAGFSICCRIARDIRLLDFGGILAQIGLMYLLDRLDILSKDVIKSWIIRGWQFLEYNYKYSYKYHDY